MRPEGPNVSNVDKLSPERQRFDSGAIFLPGAGERATFFYGRADSRRNINIYRSVWVGAGPPGNLGPLS